MDNKPPLLDTTTHNTVRHFPPTRSGTVHVNTKWFDQVPDSIVVLHAATADFAYHYNRVYGFGGASMNPAAFPYGYVRSTLTGTRSERNDVFFTLNMVRMDSYHQARSCDADTALPRI
jgi:hypothetical protein